MIIGHPKIYWIITVLVAGGSTGRLAFFFVLGGGGGWGGWGLGGVGGGA